MTRALAALVALSVALALGVAVSAVGEDASPTGYFLPRGYKVRAEIRVPGSPFWPGDLWGDIVGVACSQYRVLVVGVGYKTWSGEADSGVRVYWVEGGVAREVARKYRLGEGVHAVEIVYGHDGYVYISVDGAHVYGFAANVPKYVIVSRGAKVGPPEPLPAPTATSPAGYGYTPKSAGELRTQYMLLGCGLGALVALVALMVLGRGRRAAPILIVIALLLPPAVAVAETRLYTLYPSGVSLSEGDSVAATLDPSTGEEQLIGVREGEHDYFIGLFPDAGVVGVYRGFNDGEGQVALWQTDHNNEKHEARIEYRGGSVLFYVDGVLRYSFRASRATYDVLVCNVNPTTPSTTTTTVGPGGAGSASRSHGPHIHCLALGLGALVVALMVLATRVRV